MSTFSNKETLYSCDKCSTKTNGKKFFYEQTKASDKKLLEVHRLMCTNNSPRSPSTPKSLKRRAVNQPLITKFFKKVKTAKSRTSILVPIIDLVSFRGHCQIHFLPQTVTDDESSSDQISQDSFVLTGDHIGDDVESSEKIRVKTPDFLNSRKGLQNKYFSCKDKLFHLKKPIHRVRRRLLRSFT